MKFFIIHFIFSILFSNCDLSSQIKIPSSIPKEAKFDRKKNIYVLRTKEKETVWYNSGAKYFECNLGSNGLFNGICNYYSEKNQNLISTGKYVNSLRDGIWLWYFPNGKIYYKQEFNHEKRRSDFIVETNLIGTEHGSYERFYDNGKLEEKGFYNTGYKTGSWEKYFRNGQIEFKGEYLKGKRISNWVYFYPNKQIEAKEFFDELGNLKERLTYDSFGKALCTIKSQKEFTCY